jgi:hypothetical protein
MKNTRFFSAFTVMALLFAGCQTQTKDQAYEGVIFNEETNEVSLANTTEESVNLEFKFNKGDKVENVIEMTMEIEMMGQKMPATILVEGNYEITEVDGQGNADVNYSMSRMKIDATAQGVNFDSNEKPELIKPEMAPVLKMLNKGVISKISPKGKVLGTDYSQLINDFGAEYAMLKASMEQNINQFTQSSFATLPNEPVKVGDTYDGEILEQNFQGFPMKVTMNYKVKSISEDKTKVILEPEGSIEFNTIDLPEGIAIKMNSSKTSGWILIDLSRGMVLKSNLVTLMDFSTTQMGQQADMVLRMNMAMTTK